LGGDSLPAATATPELSISSRRRAGRTATPGTAVVISPVAAHNAVN